MVRFVPPSQASQVERKLTEWLHQDVQKIEVLMAVKKLTDAHQNLGSFFVAAGFLRNMYWDQVHAFPSTPLADIDVVYFHKQHPDKAQDEMLEQALTQHLPSIPWSVKNQARMHTKSGHVPYISLEDALSNWVETATAIGVRVADNHRLEFIAPWGYQDLVDLVLRPTPFFEQQLTVFEERIQSKKWLEKWPKLKVVWPNSP
ncbi:MAG TPA: nitrate reductase [Microscillaceae bacterium]|nr:nitrate reductase [Microscillaceae bacterium]